MILNRTPLVLAVLAAGSVTSLSIAHPGDHHTDSRTVTIEPVRDAARASEILTAERENLPKPKLNIGMKAPELSIAEWVKGESISDLADGKTHVVEFWATWCMPCIRAFPHLSELQDKHADNLRIIGVNIWDREQNRQTGEFTEPMPEFVQRVKDFVAEQAERMDYTVAIEQSGKMADEWMLAAGRSGIPSAFIVDGEGTVAWIGHPMAMDEPIEEIIEGTWDLDAAQEQYTQEIETGYWYRHLMTLLADEETAARGYRLGYALLRSPIADQPAMLNAIAWNVLTAEYIPVRDRDMAIALAAVASEKTDWKDPSIIDTLARGYFDKGDHAKAVDLQQKAVDLAEDTPMHADLLETLERYKEAARD